MTERKAQESTILIRLSGNDPRRLLAVSANKAVAVHEMATMRAMISPK
jgi:hypothetical protein